MDAGLADIECVLDDLGGHPCLQLRAPRAKPGHAIDDVLRQVETIEGVEDRQVEARCRAGQQASELQAPHIHVCSLLPER